MAAAGPRRDGMRHLGVPEFSLAHHRRARVGTCAARHRPNPPASRRRAGRNPLPLPPSPFIRLPPRYGPALLEEPPDGYDGEPEEAPDEDGGRRIGGPGIAATADGRGATATAVAADACAATGPGRPGRALPLGRRRVGHEGQRDRRAGQRKEERLHRMTPWWRRSGRSSFACTRWSNRLASGQHLAPHQITPISGIAPLLIATGCLRLSTAGRFLDTFFGHPIDCEG